MAELLKKIEQYWSTRTEGYSEVNEKELAGIQKQAWLSVLEEHFPKKKKDELKILDIGTGPGFFPVILTQAGYQVTAVDYTQGMLEKARENIKMNGKKCGKIWMRKCLFFGWMLKILHLWITVLMLLYQEILHGIWKSLIRLTGSGAEY